MTFQLEIHSRDMEIDQRLQDYVEKKAKRLERYIKNIQDVRVDLSHVKSARSASDRFIGEITLRGKGLILRAEERADDIYPAFDNALQKLQRRIERYKGKHYRGRGDGSSVKDLAATELSPESDEEYNEILRRKKFLLMPMDEYEALEQMKLSGHEDFFIFFNVENNAVNVLYRRKDGGFGLIEAELG
jgi:putative sigma-54 modulation protein